MTTHVIILAQGQQSRLPELTVPKQMLELPACGGVAIIDRTLHQLAMLDDHAHITVVCGEPLRFLLTGVAGDVYSRTKRAMSLETHQLDDPGNSSIKGISRYLLANIKRPGFDVTQTVVLLGDVVYSWACLRACLSPTHWHMGFVGTKDLSPSSGEIWGLTWEESARAAMMEALAAALEKHPPFHDTYQPGQMRRWLWAIDQFIDTRDRGAATRGAEDLHSAFVPRRTWYTAIDDYTMDVDLPKHIPMLQAASEAACADDAANGLHWRAER